MEAGVGFIGEVWVGEEFGVVVDYSLDEEDVVEEDCSSETS